MQSLAIAFISLGALLCSRPALREQVGPLPDGSFLLTGGWRLAPAGRQVPLNTLPMATASVVSSALATDGWLDPLLHPTATTGTGGKVRW